MKELLERAEQEIFAISEREVRPAFVRIDALLGDAFRKTIEQLHEQKQAVTGVPDRLHRPRPADGRPPALRPRSSSAGGPAWARPPSA